MIKIIGNRYTKIFTLKSSNHFIHCMHRVDDNADVNKNMEVIENILHTSAMSSTGRIVIVARTLRSQ